MQATVPPIRRLPNSRASAFMAGAGLIWGAALVGWLAGASLDSWPMAVLMIAPPLLLAAALAFVPGGPPHGSGRARTLVDGLIVGGSALFIAWTLGLSDLYRTADWPCLAAASAWVVVAGGAIVIFTRCRPEARPLLGRLAAGVTALAIATGAFIYIEMDGSANAAQLLYLGFPAGWLLVALSAQQRPPAGLDPEPELPGRGSVFIPSTPFAIGLVFAGLAAARGEFDDFLIWTAVAVTVLIVMRQVLSLVENISFWRRLRSRVEAQNDELRRSEARFRSLVQHSSDVITLIGADGQVLYQSPSIEAVFGHSPITEVESLLDLLHPDDRDRVLETAAELRRQPGRAITLESRVADGDGDWRYAETVVANRLDDPAVSAYVINTRDVTARKERAELAHRALHDPLTELANRTLFRDRVEHAIKREERRGGRLAVLFLDLDGFKDVNDQFGHAVGDEVLAEAAGRIKQCVRTSDTPARIGGDEFGILVEELEDSPGGTLAQRLVDAFEDPFEVMGTRQRLSVSIGIATWPEDGKSLGDLLHSADLAMYSAKSKSRVAGSSSMERSETERG